jgi:hypothetical protein
MTIHNLNRSGGPCWSRQLGYHQPPALPPHILRILLAPKPAPAPKPAEKQEPQP